MSSLDELVKLQSAATPGPWSFEETSDGWDGMTQHLEVSPEDAAFIAAAGSTDFAALAAERDRLREALEAAQVVITSRRMGYWSVPEFDALETALRAALAPGTPVDVE